MEEELDDDGVLALDNLALSKDRVRRQRRSPSSGARSVEAGFSRRSHFEAADDITLLMQAIAMKPWEAAPASRGWATVVVALRVRARKDSSNW